MMNGDLQKTILLVEDEVVTAMAKRSILEKFGNRVLTAHSGEEAVAAVEKTPEIDLVLMDINLGAGIDGTEAAEIILKNRDLPVVFLSGHSEPEIVARTEGITSYGYVVKHSSNTVLDASIKMAFKLFEAKTKETEKDKALRESEEKFRAMAEQLEDALFTTDDHGIITYISPSSSRVFGWLPEEMIGRSFVDFLPASEIPKALQAFQTAISTGQPNRNLILLMKRRDDSVFFGEIKGSPLDKNRRNTGTLGLIRDITARKQAEEEIQRQLAEKEILLKEVHHRIKNNITSIGGLLTLRLKSISNPEAISVLQEALGRVDSMRLLYDKLLLSEDYKDIPVKNYVESLAATVISLFPGQADVKLDLRIADFQLDQKQLFPLGIIINELLTNIMKYAFSGREKGTIILSLAQADGRVTLTMQDNGVGLPDGFDLEGSKGFGLILVKMLRQQLGGSFTIEKHKGTRCTVVFDV